ncbi:MAG: antibiotic biosynthesis monooxygenase [Moorea sp. SIO2B7]|nr:antibiotic biosynthesis monooxygenase [Moorena sp. SIO2B7]
MSDNIYTIAILKAKEGCLGDLKDTLSVLATETRKEPGAIEYFFVQDVNHDPNTIVSYEKWQNAAEEAKHWQTPHLKIAIETMKNILDGEPIIHKGLKVI